MHCVCPPLFSNGEKKKKLAKGKEGKGSNRVFHLALTSVDTQPASLQPPIPTKKGGKKTLEKGEEKRLGKKKTKPAPPCCQTPLPTKRKGGGGGHSITCFISASEESRLPSTFERQSGRSKYKKEKAGKNSK